MRRVLILSILILVTVGCGFDTSRDPCVAGGFEVEGDIPTPEEEAEAFARARAHFELVEHVDTAGDLQPVILYPAAIRCGDRPQTSCDPNCEAAGFRNSESCILENAPAGEQDTASIAVVNDGSVSVDMTTKLLATMAGVIAQNHGLSPAQYGRCGGL